MPAPTINERTRATADPVRNFKFLLQFIHRDNGITSEINRMGFTSVEGLSMSTDVSAYREGGMNTNPHKLPGQTDFSPITCASGVFFTKPGMWNLAKQMFSVQWGQGTLGMGAEFRFDLIIRVLDHPVTSGVESGVQGNASGSVLGFKAYNAWAANVAFGGLNAGDNGVLVHNMTIHHEGFQVVYGNAAARTL